MTGKLMLSAAMGFVIWEIIHAGLWIIAPLIMVFAGCFFDSICRKGK